MQNRKAQGPGWSWSVACGRSGCGVVAPALSQRILDLQQDRDHERQPGFPGLSSNSPITAISAAPQELLRRRPSKNGKVGGLGRNGCGVVAPALSQRIFELQLGSLSVLARRE
jgi:hypothetical protein